MKKWFVLVLLLFLVACSDGEKTASTPEEALQWHEQNKDLHIINATEVSEEERYYVFEGHNNRGTEWYVAYVQKKEADSWVVVEAINIGLPSSYDYINYSGGRTFRARICREGDLIEEGVITVTIPYSNYFVAIERIS